MLRQRFFCWPAANAAAVGWLLAAAALPAPAQPPLLTVGVVQPRLEPTLAENCDKVVRFVAEAKAKGCRVVVFPETAQYSPPGTPPDAVAAAFDEVRKAADAHDVYVLCCGPNLWAAGDRRNERLQVFDPDGRTIHTYDKLWSDPRFDALPGTFAIDGVPCAAAICADRWLRGVEDLPAVKDARVLFECSNNYADEWLPDQGWFWYAPRAVRNQAYVVFADTAAEKRVGEHTGHGHCAVFDPNGRLVTAAGGESDRLLVATLDLSKATRGRADDRRRHPAFQPFWDSGLTLLGGGSVPTPAVEPFRSPRVELTLAAAQMPCSRSVATNVSRMKELIRDAKAKGADLIAFPELAVTGARADDIERFDESASRTALTDLRAAAKAEGVAVAFGMPFTEGGRRYNGAYVVGPDGTLLTRYAQLVVDRPEVFAPGAGPKAMWFTLKGVPAVVTVGRDALWSEIAELAAVRGAQVHVHLAYGRDVGPEGSLFRRQLWANLASFRTFTVTANAADPAGLPDPSDPADGGSAIWNDIGRDAAKKTPRKPGTGYAPYSAVQVAEAGAEPTLVTATLTVGGVNPHLDRVTRKTHPRMLPWYLVGAAAVADDPPADRPWRTLPLVEGGKVSRDWAMLGWGGFVVDGDGLRTESDDRGMGMLLYTKERFGNCQIRVVYKTKDAKSNSGLFIRLDDGVLARVGEKSEPVRRGANGKLSKDMLGKIMEASDKELGGWYPVHHGYEVQICDTGDALHRTGAVYSLTAAAAAGKPTGEWRTMVITLKGDLVLVDLDGQRLTTFDPGKVARGERKWTEPKLDAKRPEAGYIGLQTHDPGDVVTFKEVSVRPLGGSP